MTYKLLSPKDQDYSNTDNKNVILKFTLNLFLHSQISKFPALDDELLPNYRFRGFRISRFNEDATF